MTDHPITPPPELVREWIGEANHNEPMFAQVAVMGAQWGADQELEACCEWVGDGRRENLSQLIALRDARRPKPPSLKEQALALIQNSLSCHHLSPQDEATIRRALEQLDD